MCSHTLSRFNSDCIHCRTLPLFVWHRQNWDIVYPQLELEETELSTLTSHGTYVAGFTDPAIEGRTDLYDLFVNGIKQTTM